MSEIVHLVVEKGADKGKKITVSPEGVRLGRSSKNDVVLADPMLSRHHCRLFFKTGDGLWITDLGSSNQTLVNNLSASETRLHPNDFVTIGDTLMRVVSDQLTPPASPATGAPAAPASEAKPVVDLGLSGRPPGPARRRIGLGPLVLIEVIVLAAALWIWYPRLRAKRHAAPKAPVVEAPVSQSASEISYEKIQATPENIFRYHLVLSPRHVLSVQIDDLQNNRHVRKEKDLGPEAARAIAASIMNAGFLGLEEDYQGIQPDVHESWSLSVTLGTRTHRSRVVNRVPPELFQKLTEMVEDCGRNELGLWAIQFSADKLLEMAQDAYLLGQKLYDEREIQFGNLAGSIKSLEEANWYLETVEPKPQYFGDLMAKLSDYRKDLEAKYNEHNFRVTRAYRLREWDEAARELRTVLEMIPNQTDPRHADAWKKLLDVENRLKEKK